MNNWLRNTLIALTLVTATGLAAADERFDHRGAYSLDRLEWRLGDARGAGHDILYRAPGERRWRVAPGRATDVADGWVLGVDRHRGGYGIYQWNGRGWSRRPGAAMEIGGSYRQPWVVNDRGVRFVWTGYEWRETRFDRDDRRERDGWRGGRGRDRYDRDDRDDRRGRG